MRRFTPGPIDPRDEAPAAEPRPTGSIAERLFEKAGQTMDPEWRRQADRRDIREALDIQVENERQQLFGYTIDVSNDSIGITCKQHLEPDSTVRIRLSDNDDGQWCCAVVVHCTQAISGFKIGLRMLP